MSQKLTIEEKLTSIQTKLSNLMVEGENDCKFDKTDMQTAFNISTALSKWIRKKIEWNQTYRILEEKRKVAWRERYEFYQTEYTLKLTTKDEYTLFIESDIHYVDHMRLTAATKEVIQYIDSIIDTLKIKNYEIKNYVDYYKFVNGQ